MKIWQKSDFQGKVVKKFRKYMINFRITPILKYWNFNYIFHLSNRIGENVELKNNVFKNECFLAVFKQ